MKILLVDNGTRYLKILKAFLRGFQVKIVPWPLLHLSQINEFDLVILSGGHILPVKGHAQKYRKEISLIRKTETPIIGICLGFELVAYAFGATLIKMVAPEKGNIKITPTLKDVIFKNLPNFRVYENHRWVVRKLPNILVPLARSRDSVEAFRHKKRLIYGFQFHPEMFVRKTAGDEIFRNTIKTILHPNTSSGVKNS